MDPRMNFGLRNLDSIRKHESLGVVQGPRDVRPAFYANSGTRSNFLDPLKRPSASSTNKIYPEKLLYHLNTGPNNCTLSVNAEMS